MQLKSAYTKAVLRRLKALAKDAGVRWDGQSWTGLTAETRQMLRERAERLGLSTAALAAETADGLVQDLTDPAYAVLAKKREFARLSRERERLTDRFRFLLSHRDTRQLAERYPEEVARLVEADLPVASEAVAWVSQNPGVGLELGATVCVDSTVVRAARHVALGQAKAAVLARRKNAVLAGAAFDPVATAEELGISVDTVKAVSNRTSPEVHIRAEIKKRLVDLWKARAKGRFPEQPGDDRWSRIAWTAFVAMATPPVYRDARRWEARKTLGKELAGLGLTADQLGATLHTARKAAAGA